MQRSSRAQANVVGFALLVGLTIVSVTGIVVLGAQGLGALQDEAAGNQAEHAFTQLDSVGAEVALGQSEARQVDLGTRDGQLSTVPTGTMTLAYTNGTTIHTETLGAVVYRRDGAVVAYQGGGVWRGSGNDSRMVSPPELHYRDGTLTLPLIAVQPGSAGTSRDLTVRKVSTQPGLGPGVVENEVLTLSVQSDYYMGWKQFFESRLSDTHVSVDHGTQTTTVELGRLDFGVTYDQAIFAEDGDVEVSTGNAQINGPVAAEGSVTTAQSGSISGSAVENAQSTYDPLDPLIDQRMASAPSDPAVTTEDIDDGDTITGGTTVYDPDGFTLGNNEEVVVDLAAGNVTLLVDGDVTLDKGTLRVVNPGDNRLKLFTTGDLSIDNGEMYVDPVGEVDAEHLLVFGRSDMQVGMAGGSGTYFEGAIYAPRDTEVSGVNTAYPGPDTKCDLGGYYADTCLATGSSSLDGAVIAGPTMLQQSTELTFDASLSELELTITANGVVAPELVHLHLSVNRIEVDGGTSGA